MEPDHLGYILQDEMQASSQILVQNISYSIPEIDIDTSIVKEERNSPADFDSLQEEVVFEIEDIILKQEPLENEHKGEAVLDPHEEQIAEFEANWNPASLYPDIVSFLSKNLTSPKFSEFERFSIKSLLIIWNFKEELDDAEREHLLCRIRYYNEILLTEREAVGSSEIIVPRQEAVGSPEILIPKKEAVDSPDILIPKKAVDSSKVSDSSIQNLENIHFGEDCVDQRQNIDEYDPAYPLNLQSMLEKHVKTVAKNKTDPREEIMRALYEHEDEDDTTKPFLCPKCSFASLSWTELTKHLHTHTSKKVFKCEHCSFISPFHSLLVIHNRKHTKEKPYKCDQCDCSFTQNYSLKQHLMGHVGFKPFQCQYCEYGSVQKSNVLRHIREQHDPKTEAPYKCELCSETFSQKGNRVRHMKMHTEEAGFKCELCSASFLHKVTLAKHMKKHKEKKI